MILDIMTPFCDLTARTGGLPFFLIIGRILKDVGFDLDSTLVTLGP